MFGFTKSKRPIRSHPDLRSILRLEELGVRATPTDLFGDPTPSDPVLVAPPAQTAPFIDSFDASEVAHGWYQITGHITGTNVGGLVVRFDGIPALDGRTATTAADGSFTLTFQVQTNGNDIGTISAQTTGTNGQDSNIAYAYVSPTP